MTRLAWIILIVQPTVFGVILTLIVVALGEITQSPRYYEYISRLAPPGQQGTYMGFAFLPLGVGSLIAGPFRRISDASLRRGETPAGNDVGGDHRR